MSKPPSVIRLVLAFVFVAPMLPILGVFAWEMYRVRSESGHGLPGSMLVAALVVGVTMAYVVGAFPALATALICSRLTGWARSPPAWIALCGLVGGLAAGVVAVVGPVSNHRWEVAICGIAAGLIGGWLTRWRAEARPTRTAAAFD